MNRSPTPARLTCGQRLQRQRHRSGLSRAALAAISGVGVDFIGALENDCLCHLLSDQEIQYALSRSTGDGAQRLMQRTLGRWAEGFHRLADALADTFEDLFPADDLSALSDQLWLKIQRASAGPVTADNPWHGWGWFRTVALSDNLPDETIDDQFQACELRPVIHELLADLDPHEQTVIALRYGFTGAHCSRAEVGHRLGLTSAAVRRIEQRALRHLQHPRCTRRLREYLN